MKLLLDANLSPETRDFLSKRFRFDVVALIATRSFGVPDVDVVQIAKDEQRVIMTFDLDFGEIYYLRERGKIGVIILRLEDQTPESVNATLAAFFATSQNVDLTRALVVIEADRVRIVNDNSP